MRVLLGAEVVEGVAAAGLPVAGDLALLDLEPVGLLAAGGEAGAADVAHAVERVDDDRVIRGALAVLDERVQVEHVNALELGEQLETVDTGGNLERRRLLARLGVTGTKKGVRAGGLLELGGDLVVGGNLVLAGEQETRRRKLTARNSGGHRSAQKGARQHGSPDRCLGFLARLVGRSFRVGPWTSNAGSSD